MDATIANLTVPEQDHFHLDCNILSPTSQDSRFAVTWFIMKNKDRSGQTGHKNEEDKEALLRVGQDFVFSRENSPWEGRLRFQRLSAMFYRLTVLQAASSDAGNYSCHVEEWLPDPKGVWYKLTEEDSGLITVYVQDTGKMIKAFNGQEWSL